MLKKLLFVAMLFATHALSAQLNIKSEDIAKYVGQKVEVKAKVAGIFTKNAKFVALNMVEDFPKQTFQVIVFADKLEKFGGLEKYEGKEVTLLGEVSLFPKVPKEGKKQNIQIILNSPEQIEMAK
jgi:hypothetical protein